MYEKAIVILGCGIDAEGNLNPDAENSVRLGIEASRSVGNACLIMTGFVSYKADFKPSISEAQAMKDYAGVQGYDQSRIFVETESKDSLGNFVFTKLNLLEPLAIRTLDIVRGPNQTDERIAFLARKVLGSEYEFTVIAPDIQRPEEREREQKSLDLAHRLLDPIEDGDAKAIYELLQEKHPGYNSTIRLEDLKSLL